MKKSLSLPLSIFFGASFDYPQTTFEMCEGKTYSNLEILNGAETDKIFTNNSAGIKFQIKERLPKVFTIYKKDVKYLKFEVPNSIEKEKADIPAVSTKKIH
ncbi:hypothetical protein [uncultured Dysgonomonas sp.]|uniref:Uncharacterized protein n=1 Tax=uncultured Dysgonomonas sp. TaxID=206096 RepID=A0A212JX03_9BACT|nr:hypothetical protein [uncultured Dysgonomonas sp.]SBW03898.1 hypothetical protein KL86DYS1_30699 [uncultured Dysgonomonas sp.]